jgi:uncharacterized protein involved in exopolysaccharide biosynthesis
MNEDWDEQPSGSNPLSEIARDPLGVIRRHWKPMLAAVLVGLLVTAGVVAMQTPQYLARATILLASQKLSESFVRPTIAEDVLERVNALTAEALSRERLAPLVQKHNLYPEIQERFGMVGAVDMLRAQITVGTDRGGRGSRAMVLSVSASDGDPKRAADLANDVAQIFVDTSVRLRTAQTRLATEFLQREMESAEAAMREQDRTISEFQKEHRGQLPSELESNLRRLERLQQQRISLAMQIAEGESRLAMLSTAEDPAAGRVRELEAQLVRELGVNKETHPNVISLRRQIQMARGELGKQVTGSGIPASVGRKELALLREQLAATDRDLERLDAAVAAIPERQEQLSGMLERQRVLQETYLEFLRKVKDAELAKSLELAQQGDRVAILDAATPPGAPENPVWLFLLGGVVGSLGLALGIALLLELLDPVLVSTSGLEAATGAPVLGTVPRMT